jgi:Bacterial PH domain
MVSKKIVSEQLKKISFDAHGWNKSEVKELHNILLTDEVIYECVNGVYEGGFALLVATDIRVLLVDKKPLSFLSVEDLRFDMINEIDYSHRLMGSNICITTGSKTLNFRSYNKERLRKLIGHVQHCMADNKKKQTVHAEDQKQHLEQINNQLQTYLVAQYKQQQKLQEHLTKQQPDGTQINDQDSSLLEPIKPSNELSDYLYAHGLIDKYRQETGEDLAAEIGNTSDLTSSVPSSDVASVDDVKSKNNPQNSQLAEIYADGVKEVFGKHEQLYSQAVTPTEQEAVATPKSLEVNPVKVAYSKLPMLWRSRKFGLSIQSKRGFPIPQLDGRNT